MHRFTAGSLVMYDDWWPLLNHQPMAASKIMGEFFVVLSKLARLANPEDVLGRAEKKTIFAFCKKSFAFC